MNKTHITIWICLFLFFVASTSIGQNGIPPKEFILNQNYPNPFNPSTSIKFTLPGSEFVNLKIFDTLGQKAESISYKRMKAGNYEMKFNAQYLSSGIFYYRIEAGDFQDVKRMILIK